MNEEFKDLKFYSAPRAEPSLPIPPAPKRGPYDEIAERSICFIQNPKSLPTDLRAFERPRQYHDQLKALPVLPSKPPAIKPSKNTGRKLTAKVLKIIGGPRDPPGIERHVMQVQGTRLRKIKDMVKPLQLTRKKVPDYSVTAEIDEEAEGEDGKKGGMLSTAELKKIAPDGGAARNKKFLFKKKTRQIYEHDPKAREIRQREALPWVLESDVSSATPTEELRGNFEGGSNSRYMALCFRKGGGFTLKPLKRLYNFQPRPSYHIPTAEENEELLNAKKKVDMNKWFALTKSRPTNNEEPNESRFKAIEKEDEDGDDEDGRPSRGGRGDDIEELDFDEDFQDDEEMGADSTYEETKENEDKLKKKQSRLNPSSFSSDDSDSDAGSKDKKSTDPSVKKLKKMVGDNDDSDSDSDSETEAPAPIKKMELPSARPLPVKKDLNPPSNSKDSTNNLAAHSNKPKKRELSPAPSKKANLISQNSKRPMSPAKQSDTNKSKHAKLSKPAVSPSSNNPSGSGSSSQQQTEATRKAPAVTPELIASTVRKNPGIKMRELVSLLGLNSVKVSVEQKKKMIDMFSAVLKTNENGELVVRS